MQPLTFELLGQSENQNNSYSKMGNNGSKSRTVKNRKNVNTDVTASKLFSTALKVLKSDGNDNHSEVSNDKKEGYENDKDSLSYKNLEFLDGLKRNDSVLENFEPLTSEPTGSHVLQLNDNFVNSNANMINLSSNNNNENVKSNKGIPDAFSNYDSVTKAQPSNVKDKNVPYFTEMSNSGFNVNSDKTLLEKLNYVIHLLEEEKDEKTNNVGEEVVLYCFLGVFVIFVVDSFARVGKYVR